MFSIWLLKSDGSVEPQPHDGSKEEAIQRLRLLEVPAVVVWGKRIEAATGHTRPAHLALVQARLTIGLEPPPPAAWPIEAWNPDRQCPVGSCGAPVPRPTRAFGQGLHVFCGEHRSRGYDLINEGIGAARAIELILADQPRFFGGRYVEGTCVVCGSEAAPAQDRLAHEFRLLCRPHRKKAQNLTYSRSGDRAPAEALSMLLNSFGRSCS